MVLANRLPVRRSNGGWATSPGGLVSALTPIVRERTGLWIGWTGEPDEAVEPFEHDGIGMRPVTISRSEIDDHYLGFCNSTVWPLFHDAVRTPEFHRHWWRAYRAVNERFADAAVSELRDGDLVWVNDYQLLLAPAMIREVAAGDGLHIGFFLHIPFPPVEIFARLPWRTQIVEGLLGADVVAFQTERSAANFADAVERFTDAVVGRGRVAYHGRRVRIEARPIAIDTGRFEQLRRDSVTEAHIERLRAELGDPSTVVLGVDRLDYTKGIDVRLRAFETLLERHADIAGDTVFMQIAVPSREAIVDYEEMRERVEGLVGRINGSYGGPHHMPVHYVYGGVPPEELVAYYALADVMAVTPLADGMNLVAKEYVACRAEDDGVLVLSEFAGASDELEMALLVNPYDLDGVAAVLGRAISMPEGEQAERMSVLREVVRRHDVHRWARECLGSIAAPDGFDGGVR